MIAAFFGFPYNRISQVYTEGGIFVKKIREYIADDMFNHILMSGGEIRACVNGSKYPTLQDKLGYCEGIMTVFPHMLLGNFTRWLWDGESPKPYEGFMQPSMEAVQAKALPLIRKAFSEEVTAAERGALLIPVLTDIVPKAVLTGYYNYMFEGAEDYKDIAEFWPRVEPLLAWTARALKDAYSETDPLPTEQMEELYLFIGTRMPFILLKRWYDWQFGEEKLEMPPPPPQD